MGKFYQIPRYCRFFDTFIMNARSHIFELAVEPWQVEESLLSIFHPILFHRTTGKFTYQLESSYSVGTVGYEDIDCDTIDHTYIRYSSFKYMFICL